MQDETDFSLVEVLEATERQIRIAKGKGRNKWECAAPKIIKAARKANHRIHSMSEQWFDPHNLQTIIVSYVSDGTKTSTSFNSGDTVPSCDICQVALVEDLCDNDNPC